jgi:8-oxo-dGTP pyrophosphatase MutT (NUDIX family)
MKLFRWITLHLNMSIPNNMKRAEDLFPNRLPESRLGTAHPSLEAFELATNHFVTKKTKEYSLVMVTEPATRRILLGLKHRGFGIGMYNSFGGKLDPNETMDQCAARELEEETGIAVPSPSLLNKVACHHFTFEDSDTKMVVHVYRINVSCATTASDSSSKYYTLDPSVIRGCEEITPQWFDDWYHVPLYNMFADDSVWLTKVLTSSADDRLHIDGYFHFEPGGQDVNTIRHYFMDTRGKSLEQSLFHALHRNEISSPSIKEFKEAYAFANAVKSFFGKHAFDVAIDVAGGHGALAALILLTTSATKAVVIDPANVGNGGVQRAWGSFLKEKSLTYQYECLRTGLPSTVDIFLKGGIPPSRILVVACHACQHLSDEILQISCETFGVAAAVMPCCQKDTSPGGSWKSISKNLGVPFATVMDLLLAGKTMTWSLPYDIRMKTIDGNITPQNRVILCKPLPEPSSKIAIDKAHERLERVYRRAHQVTIRPNPLNKIDFASLGVGVAIGAIVAVAVIRQ